MEKNKPKDIKTSLDEELKKESDEQTSIQIRLFDDKTGSVAYKHLKRDELNEILSNLDELVWICRSTKEYCEWKDGKNVTRF